MKKATKSGTFTREKWQRWLERHNEEVAGGDDKTRHLREGVQEFRELLSRGQRR